MPQTSLPEKQVKDVFCPWKRPYQDIFLHEPGITKAQEEQENGLGWKGVNTVPHRSMEMVNQHDAYASLKYVCLFVCLSV